MDFKTGGQRVIERLVQAYGFTTRQALCDHLGVSKSTLATRYMRDIFPAEWVIQCALETKVSLLWLTTGEGNIYEGYQTDFITLPIKKIINGKVQNGGECNFDLAILPAEVVKPVYIINGNVEYIADSCINEISDGKWLIEVNEQPSIRNIIRLPGKKVKVEAGDLSYECQQDDISFKYKIIITLNKEGISS